MSGALPAVRSHDELDELLATSDRPVLVDVTASWCGPCQALTPILEEFAAAQDGVRVFALDADDPRSLSWRLGGGSIPRLFLFDRGRLQLEVAGLRDRAWLDEVIGKYPSLGIDEPDGLPVPARTPARTVTLPEPPAGAASLMVVRGDSNDFDHGLDAPVTVDVPADSVVILNASTDAVAAGYLDALDGASIDHLRLAGQARPAHLRAVAAALPGLQCLVLVAYDQAEVERRVKEAEERGEALDAGQLRAEMCAEMAAGDLAPLEALPDLRRIDVIGRPDLGVPGRGDGRIAPSLAAALGPLPERAAGGEDDGTPPFGTSCILTRRPDGLLDMKVHLAVRPGWYAYPPGSDEGVPVSIEVDAPHHLVSLAASADGAHLEGRATLDAVLEGDGDEVRLRLTAQVCDGTTCLPPSSIPLVVPVTHRRPGT